ncbi:MAG: methyltransferase domain-containing protein [Nocardioides sp.]|uniref:class I SAM-dependent methyltransferase n=1 Tax=Nocardioides sp. TaxID=35761 RepID=UPI00238DBF7B|nr:methyltransferase domain-containing protein [Nocardioides sp.]MDE0775687.1 methyltransferase domain-containing protein [Nocardioides sp.]
MAEIQPITIDEMYGVGDVGTTQQALDRSYVTRRVDDLLVMIDDLEIGPGDVVLDIGGREAWHCLALVQAFGCRAVSVEPVAGNNDRARAAVAEHPLGSHVSIRPGVMEDIPAADGEFDFILSHDMFFQVVDADRALAEGFRVLKQGGHLLLYQTFATDRLEHRERAGLYADLAVVAERMDPDDFEGRALSAGFSIEVVDIVGSEWREASEEDGVHLTSRQLLYAARLLRNPGMLRAELGDIDYRVELGNALWGVYQMIGKLEPRLYVLRRPEA